MNRYYVSVARGSDSNDGLSPTTPWKTIGKAIGASPGAALGVDGTTVYVEPGVYYETVTMGLSGAVGQPLRIVGDRDGYGFASGGHASPRTGVVEWVAWSDDSTALSGPCLTSSKTNVAISGFKFQAAAGSNKICVSLTTGASSWSIADSTFVVRQGVGVALPTTTAAFLGVAVERCNFTGYASIAIQIYARDAGTEYSLGVTARNCLFDGHKILMSPAGTVTVSLASGVLVEHCAFLNTAAGVQCIYPAGISLTNPNVVRGCVFSGDRGIAANNSTQFAEDWNDYDCGTPRTNATAGANSRTGVRVALDYGDGLLYGVPLRPLGTPTPGSPQGGRVDPAAYAIPSVDMAGRSRPEGYRATYAAVGPLERHDGGAADATYADAGSTACLALTGPSSLERPILVDATTTTTISVKVRWDGNHGDGAKPRAILLANPDVGYLTGETLTATSAGGSGSTPNSYETLTFTPFTPTKAGAVMLRLVSRAAAGNGVAYFDSITLS